MSSVRCTHGRALCAQCVLVDDAAKRAHDLVKLKVVCTDWGTRMSAPYLAIRLSDGDSDGVMYESKQAAVRHQLHEQQCAYFSFRHAPEGFASARDAAVFLAFHRAAYDSGFRLPDPDDPGGGPDLVLPDMTEHLYDQLARLIGGRRG